jgi:hypothetical protein
VATTRASSSGPLMSYMVVTRLYRVIVKRDGSAALSAFQNRPSRSRRPAHPCGAAVTPLARPVQAALRRAAPCCTPLRRVPAARWGLGNLPRARMAVDEERWGH